MTRLNDKQTKYYFPTIVLGLAQQRQPDSNVESVVSQVILNNVVSDVINNACTVSERSSWWCCCAPQNIPLYCVSMTCTLKIKKSPVRKLSAVYIQHNSQHKNCSSKCKGSKCPKLYIKKHLCYITTCNSLYSSNTVFQQNNMMEKATILERKVQGGVVGEKVLTLIFTSAS